MSVGIATLTLLRSSCAFHPTLDSRFGRFGIAGGPRGSSRLASPLFATL